MLRNAGVVGWLCAVIALSVGGCGPQTVVVNDTGPRADTGPVPQAVVLSAAGPVDLGCVGTATIPASAADVASTLVFQEYLSHAALTSDRIEIFSTNAITDTCAAPDCTAYTTDGTGQISLTLAGGSWFAFRIAANGQTAPVIAFNQPWVSSASETLPPVPTFAPGTITVVGSLIGRMFQADRLGSMSGRAVDCSGHALQNVRARVYVDDVEVVTGPLGDPLASTISGLEGTSPTRTGLTGASGNFVGANIPPSASGRVETWATLTDGALPELIGCAEGPVVIGGITISLIGGLRSDYPAGSGCAMAAARAGH